MIRFLLKVAAFVIILAVYTPPVSALQLVNLTVTINCNNFDYTGFDYIFDRDTTGANSETFYIEIVDGAGTVLHRIPGVGNAGPVGLGTYFEGGAAGNAYNIAPPQFSPVIYRWVSPGGNGFAPQEVLPTATILNCALPPFGGPGAPGYTSAPAPNAAINFGNVQVGTPAAQNVVITEIGTADLTGNVALINNPTGDFTLTAGAGAYNIVDGSGANVTVTIQCLPTAVGARTATLQVTSNDAANLVVNYDLTCTGVLAAAPGYASAPAPNAAINYGNVQVGTPAAQNVVITEVGTADLTGNVALINNPTGDFTLTAGGGAYNIVDGSGANVTVIVQCQPSGIGVRTATIQVTSNDAANLVVNYDLTCTGTPAPLLGVTIVQTGGGTNVAETGPTSDTYTMVLNSQPTAQVTINITPDAQCTVIPAALVFDPATWNVPQVVTVTAVDDAAIEGIHTCTITHAAVSADANYNGIAVANVVAAVADNDGVIPPPVGGGSTNNAAQVAVKVVPCADFTGQTNPIVRANIPGGTVTNGDVYCRIINENGRFVQQASEIGIQSVIDLGVVQAVDVFGLRPNGVFAQTFNNPITVCLLGTGNVYFLDNNNIPRVAVPVPASQQGGFTCASVPHGGTVVLVSGGVAGVAAVGASTSGAEIALNGCRVTTLYALRLRADANTNSAVINRVPYDLTLTATARAGNWFKVIYENGQGWLSGGYLRTNAGCG